jgi:hypothetical protein
MLMRFSPAILVLFVLSGTPIVPVCAQGAKQPAENKSAPMSSYPDTVDGLRDFLQAFVEAVKDADLLQRTRMEESLRIPEPQKWFATTYGPQVGGQRADYYVGSPPELYGYLDRCDLGSLMKIQVSHVEFPDKESAELSGIPFFRSMRHPVSFYTAYLTNREGDRRCVVYPLFVYVEHAFRAVHREFGKIEESNRPHCGLEHLYVHRVEIDGQRMLEKLLRAPTSLPFPPDTPQRNAETVNLLVSLACDGSVLETDYLSGSPELFKPAADAVKKWKYRQSFVNGLPVEVYTTADVVFGVSEQNALTVSQLPVNRIIEN